MKTANSRGTRPADTVTVDYKSNGTGRVFHQGNMPLNLWKAAGKRAALFEMTMDEYFAYLIAADSPAANAEFDAFNATVEPDDDQYRFEIVLEEYRNDPRAKKLTPPTKAEMIKQLEMEIGAWSGDCNCSEPMCDSTVLDVHNLIAIREMLMSEGLRA